MAREGLPPLPGARAGVPAVARELGTPAENARCRAGATDDASAAVWRARSCAATSQPRVGRSRWIRIWRSRVSGERDPMGASCPEEVYGLSIDADLVY
jgi:hypothetical protein